MSIQLTDSDRARALVALYNHIHSEITRYRDMEWRILTWTVALLAGIVTVSKGLGLPDQLRMVLKTLLFVFTILAAVGGSLHIHFAHVNLTANRNRRRTSLPGQR